MFKFGGSDQHCPISREVARKIPLFFWANGLLRNDISSMIIYSINKAIEISSMIHFQSLDTCSMNVLSSVLVRMSMSTTKDASYIITFHALKGTAIDHSQRLNPHFMATYNIHNHFNLSMSYTPSYYFKGMYAQWCNTLSGWMKRFQWMILSNALLKLNII